MKVFLTPTFINDLKNSGDARFIRQVLNHTIDNDGNFTSNAYDHRYNNIDNAWIRRVSGGKTAFRVIFIQNEKGIYLYRAGTHQIEDKLSPPTSLDGSNPIQQTKTKSKVRVTIQNLGVLLQTLEPMFLNKEIVAMYHIAHKEIILISPYLSFDILDRFHHFGRFLDRAIEEQTEISLITRPPEEEGALDFFRQLDERSIFVYFSEKLHAKMYFFDINQRKTPEYLREMPSSVIIGSANLTKSGICFSDEKLNDELCYKLPLEKHGEAYAYAKKLIKRSVDYRTYILKLKRGLN